MLKLSLLRTLDTGNDTDEKVIVFFVLISSAGNDAGPAPAKNAQPVDHAAGARIFW